VSNMYKIILPTMVGFLAFLTACAGFVLACLLVL
jgi:hypothetical protein